MGFFDDIVPPDTAPPEWHKLPRGGLFDDIVPPPGPGHAPQTAADASDGSENTSRALSGLFDDIVPPASAPRVRPLAAPVRLVHAPSVAFGDNDEIAERPGQYDEVVVPAQQPRKVSFGADYEIVENPTNPPRQNGTPEHLVPLAPQAPGASPTPRARR